MSGVKELQGTYNKLRQKFRKRDTRMSQVQAIREGRMSEVAPDLFPDTGPWQEPIVANMIDVAARDMAEMLAPLPSFNCTDPSTTGQAAQSRATKRTQIANAYITASDLQVQMLSAADRYVTYGMLPFRVEVDYETNMPVIRALDPVGAYPQIDRFGRVVSLFQRTLISEEDLLIKYPEMRAQVKSVQGWQSSRMLEVVFYHDKHKDCAFVVGEKPILLDSVPNPIGKCLIRVAQRPGAGEISRGQFDDVIFVQLAKSRLALLALQAAHESVNAPLVVPSDVPDIPIGPGATIHTNNPAGVGRVPLEVPKEAFAEQQILDRELQLGARFPEARTGNSDASIITGQGVQALMDGYDSQVRSHQSIFARVLGELVGLCFEMDVTLFPNLTKDLRGRNYKGSAYSTKYTAHADIADDYTVDVRYGLMAGLDPSRWLVFALQARAEKMFSRDYMRREMPVEIDVEAEAQKIDIEDLEEAAKTAVQGYAQAIPALAAQGQDPSQVLDVLSKVIEGRRKGRNMSDIVAEAFKPPEPPQPSPEEMAMMQQGMAEGGAPTQEGTPAGMTADGRMPGVAPGQMGETPGSRPDLATFIAGMDSSGTPNLQAGISRQKAF